MLAGVGLYVRVWCDRSVGWPLCESVGPGFRRRCRPPLTAHSPPSAGWTACTRQAPSCTSGNTREKGAYNKTY